MVLRAGAYKLKLLKSWRGSGHPSCTVVILFAPTVHLLHPEHREARENHLLFHLTALKYIVDEDVLPVLSVISIIRQRPPERTQGYWYNYDISASTAKRKPVVRWVKEPTVSPGVPLDTHGPQVSFSLAVSLNNTFSSQDLVASHLHLQCPCTAVELWDISAARISQLLQFTVIFLDIYGFLLQSWVKKNPTKHAKLSAYVFFFTSIRITRMSQATLSAKQD